MFWTPPKQVEAILREHARAHADQLLITGLATERGWDLDKVLQAYRHGVDWDAVRAILIDTDGRLSAVEKRAFGMVVVGGLWTEERRWKAGFGGHGTCCSCFLDIATPLHRLSKCPALQDHLLWQKIAGRITSPTPIGVDDAALAPLFEMGLPPKHVGWQPVEGEAIQGSLHSSQEKTYTDGSGYAQALPAQRVSTWAAVRRPVEGGACQRSHQRTRHGLVSHGTSG